MYDIIIIGGGPAGMSAAIYSARGGMKTLLLEGEMVGGQAVNAHNIENYPGFPTGVSGYELAYAMSKQVQRLGVEIKYESATGVVFEAETKRVDTKTASYECKAAIVCTGAKPRLLGVENEQRYTGAGVSYCATCDGGFFKDKVVAVAGGGDTAATDAAYLARIAKKVYIIHRRDALRASEASKNAALSCPNVQPVWNTVIAGIKGDEKLRSVLLKDVKTSAVKEQELDGLFVAIGSDPQTRLFEGILELENGYILTNRNGSTNLPGIFAAGDVCHGVLRQVVTACGSGAISADSAINYVNSL